MAADDEQVASEGERGRRPFHETIVDAILGAENFDQLFALIQLVKSTEIPTGHLAISEAIGSSVNDFFEGLYAFMGEAGMVRSGLVQDAKPEATTPDS